MCLQGTTGLPKGVEYSDSLWLSNMAHFPADLCIAASYQPLVRALESAKNAYLWRDLILKLPSFYQDRLGANIGKPLNKRDDAFFAGVHHRPTQRVDDAVERRPSRCGAI